MNDKDDGSKFLSSDIFVVSADGVNRIQLTNTSDKIEMYPEWSPKSDKIVFNTDAGEIYLMNIAIK